MRVFKASIFDGWHSAWSVIMRELRGSSHTAANYWMRVLACGVSLVVLFFAVQSLSVLSPADVGLPLFTCIHYALTATMFILVPAMTADCLAREKREGTLGLLFLTNLKAGGIVAGKSAAQFLRAWCLWLSVLPVLVIPLIWGGIEWGVILNTQLAELSILLIGLASGLLASCCVRQFFAAVALAEVLACAAAWWLAGQIMTVLGAGAAGLTNSYMLAEILSPHSVFIGLSSPQGMTSSFYRSGSNTYITTSSAPITAAPTLIFLALAIVYLLVVLLLASRWVKRSWQDKPPTRRQVWWHKTFCTDFFRNRFKRTQSKLLTRNPIAWLQVYSWKQRVVKWGFCLAVVIMASATLSGRGVPQLYLFFFALAIFYTWAGVSGFMNEKKSGALELILVTPISVKEIILGRATGLYRQFLPAAIMVLALQWSESWVQSILGRSMEWIIPWDWCFLCVFLTLPMFATYAALRVKWTLGAIILTWAGVGLEFAFAIATGGLFEGFQGNIDAFPFWFTLSSAGFAALTFFLLHHCLTRRLYSF